MASYAATQSTFLMARQSPAQRLLIVALALTAALLMALVVAIGSGSAPIPYGDVVRILLHGAGLPVNLAVPDNQVTIVLQVRLPRILAGMFVGAGLGMAGAVMQGIFRNPLADPGILGVSSGGAAGAVLAFVTGWALLGVWVVPALAFAGAMLAALLIYLLSLERGRTNITTLLLAGIALNAFLSALISVALLLSSDFPQVQTVLSWLVGGLAGRSWRHLIVLAPTILIGLAVTYGYSRDLNLFLLGEETAQGLGTNVPRTRFALLALATLMTSVGVSVAGPIAFVGLLVPHLLRLVIGPDHRVLLPASALGGAIFLVITDTVARIVIQSQEIPVGIITSLLGGPFFLYLMWRYRRNARLL
jgi:cobalamin transport system permease protein